MSNILLQRKWLRPVTPRRSGYRLIGRAIPAVALGLALLVALEWLLPALGVPAYLLPPPSRVLAQLLEPGGTLPGHALATAAATLAGLAAAATVGCALAIAFALLRPLEEALYPWVLVSQAIPAAALAPLLTIWLGNGLAPRAAMAAIFAFFPILVSLGVGMRQVRREQLDLLQSWGATRWQTLRYLRLHAGLPGLVAGLKVAAALAVVGAIVGELAGASRGLGYAISIATYHLETDRVFAAITLAAALSLGLHLAISAVARRVIFWENQ